MKVCLVSRSEDYIMFSPSQKVICKNKYLRDVNTKVAGKKGCLLLIKTNAKYSHLQIIVHWTLHGNYLKHGGQSTKEMSNLFALCVKLNLTDLCLCIAKEVKQYPVIYVNPFDSNINTITKYHRYNQCCS